MKNKNIFWLIFAIVVVVLIGVAWLVGYTGIYLQAAQNEDPFGCYRLSPNGMYAGRGYSDCTGNSISEAKARCSFTLPSRTPCEWTPHLNATDQCKDNYYTWGTCQAKEGASIPESVDMDVWKEACRIVIRDASGNRLSCRARHFPGRSDLSCVERMDDYCVPNLVDLQTVICAESGNCNAEMSNTVISGLQKQINDLRKDFDNLKKIMETLVGSLKKTCGDSVIKDIPACTCKPETTGPLKIINVQPLE